MPKVKKLKKKFAEINKIDSNKKNTYSSELINLLLATGFVLFIYLFSILRPWQPFDERLFFTESLFPIPNRFDEVKEILENFVKNYHVESMNTFFSNQVTLRSNPIAGILVVFTSFFLKKSAFLYHCLQLTIHLANTILVWCNLYALAKILNKDKTQNNNKLKDLLTPKELILISILSALWGIHSASSEAVLLVTNWDTILTYTICLLFILYEFCSIYKGRLNSSVGRLIVITILFCSTMFLTEYLYSLPLIMFFTVLGLVYKTTSSYKTSFLAATSKSTPYLLGLALFVIISSLYKESAISNITLDPLGFIFTLERNLWLSPQVFLHGIKLLIFPITLSTYQSTLVHISDKLIEPYTIACTFLYTTFLLSNIIIFFVLPKRKFTFICALKLGFFFSLLPFLQIVLPTYCLFADRYCYLPFFFICIIVFASIKTFFDFSSELLAKRIIIIFSCLLFLMTIRTLVRIQEWNSPIILYKSAIKADKNPLYKGQKLIIFANYIGSQGNQKEFEDSLNASLVSLKKALRSLEKKKEENPQQPHTLLEYGLDYKSLIIKAAYGIATIRHDNYREPPKQVLEFFEPYIKENLDLCSINPISLYADILLKAGETRRVKEVLEYAVERFPNSITLLSSLSEFYTRIENNPDKSFKLLKHAYNYFPNDADLLFKLLNYYTIKNDLVNQAKFAYLIGLRTHSVRSYQKAAQIYLDLNKLDFAHLALTKLARLGSPDPLTLLLSSRYLDLTGKREQIPELLTNAYSISKSLDTKQDISVTKSILASLINIEISKGNIANANNLINEFEKIKILTEQDKALIESLKKNIKTGIQPKN